MEANNKKTSDVLLIGFDLANDKDISVTTLVIGRRNSKGKTDIINLITGDEALEMYNRLTTVKNNVVTTSKKEEN